MTETTVPGAPTLDREHSDLLESLARHRFFLRHTARDLDDEQAARRTTVSELSIGGLIKHVASVEAMWADFILKGPESMGSVTDADYSRHAQTFRMEGGETLAVLLDRYEEVARHTEEVVRALPDLSVDHPLPPAPWFTPGARWSARRVLLHIIAETAQHAGHADIIREALDGARTMG
ncbi:MAG TPA: DinB family protein [Kineosporiaceae bacterium]